MMEKAAENEDATSHHSHHSYHDLKSIWEIPGVQPGVLTGMPAWALLQFAKANGFALPAFGVSSPDAVVSVLESVEIINFPVVIMLSMMSAARFCGDVPESDHPLEQAIIGAILAAKQVRNMALAYSVPVILQTCHVSAKQLPWLDGVMKGDWDYFRQNKEPLFSLHMLELTTEPNAVNFATCVNYMTQMEQLGTILEIGIAVDYGTCHEISKKWDTGLAGSTSQKEENIAGSNDLRFEEEHDKLYHALPQDTYQAWRTLLKVSDRFLFSFSFGEEQSIARPKPYTKRVKLAFLTEFQEYTAKLSQKDKRSARSAGHKDLNPLNFSIHGISNVRQEDLKLALGAGVIKAAVNMDSQWTRWTSILSMYESREGYIKDKYVRSKRKGRPHHGKKYRGDWDFDFEERMNEVHELAEVEFHISKNRYLQ